jgi:hypothetical protein
VTEETYERLQDAYIFEERGTIQVKGKGSMKTFLLSGRKPAASITNKLSRNEEGLAAQQRTGLDVSEKGGRTPCV